MNAALAAALRGGSRRVPLILQAEQSECGLACLAMVAGYHGRRLGLAELRAQAGLGGQGAQLRDLMQVAEQLGLALRALRVEPSELRQLRLPAILHWDLDHFVVAVRAGWRGLLVHDPARGRRWFPWHEVGNHLTGVVLELYPGPGFSRGGVVPRMRLRDFWSESSGLLRNLALVLVLSLALQLLALAAPFYVQLVVDEALLKHDAELLAILVLAFGFLALLRVLVTWVRGRLVLHAAEAMGFQMASNLLHHLLRLPLPWFERRHLGDIVSRFGSLGPVQSLLTEGFAMALVDGVMALLTLAMMWFYSPQLTAVVLLALLMYAVLRLATLPLLRRREQAQIAAGADEEAVFLETLRAVQTLKAFGREGERHGYWQEHRARTVNAEVASARLGLALGAGNGALFGIENLVVIWLGALAVLAGDFTVGMLYAFVSFKSQFTDRVITLIDRGTELGILRLHMERLAEIGQAAPERGPVRGPVMRTGRAEIVFDQVGFRHGDQTPWILEGLDLRFRAGSLNVIHGPSGAGKTTLLRLAAGLLPASAGEVRVDGQRLDADSLEAWRRRCAMVLQDDQLFAGTLLENISFFDPAPTVERVREALAQVGLAETIEALPLGLYTRLGESGVGLSGGERQRLLLARAIYLQPDTLFVDEGTAHLDPDTAALIARVLAALPMTRVVVTHDTRLFPEADQWLAFTAPGQVSVVADVSPLPQD